MSASASTLDLTMLVDGNPRYAPLTSSTILVENTAENIIYRKEPVRSKSVDSLSFTLDVTDQFVGRDMYITWDKIPLQVTRAAGAVTFTEENFHSTFFDDYDTLTMTQYGLLNAINTINVLIDGKNVSTVLCSEIMEQIGHFYDPQELQRNIDCSNRNIYYSNLVPSAVPWIPTYTTDGTQTLIKGSSLSENDPFSATVSDQYNSRTPLFSISGLPSMPSNTATVNLHGVSTWLPFNILGINGDITPIYHAKSIQIAIQLHSNWPSRIFQTKRNPGTTTITSPYNFVVDRAQWSSNEVGDININFKMYRAPNYIQKTLDYAKDRYIQSLSIVEQDTRVGDIVFKKDVRTQAVNSTPFDLRAIPKSVIIGIVNKRVSDNEYLTDATHFCRIDNLSVELNGTMTDIASGNSSEQLYYISKANGLEMNKQQALYTLGFPVYLDTTSNLGCATNSYVGLATSESSGKYTLRVKCNATRLHHDTEAADFKTTASKANLFKQDQKTYEMRVIIVYAGFFTYNLMGSKFNVIESLTRSELDSLSSHVNMLYQSFAPKMNVLGGSWLSSLVPMLKNVAKGAYNVVKAAATNKDGFRDSLAKAYKGETTGAGFDNHAPLLGGAGYGYQQSNISGGRSIKDWESL